MRARRLPAPADHGRVNVTPMIDVVMCLIVFYLIVGKLAAEQRSPVRLPEARSGDRPSAAESIIINVLPAGDPARPGRARIVVSQRDVDAAELPALIRDLLAATPGAAVHLRADRGLAYAAVAPVVAACRAAGVRTVRLATESAP